MKKCPSCKEEIKQDATKCKHCGEIQNTNEILQQNKKIHKFETVKLVLIIIVLVLGFVLMYENNWFFKGVVDELLSYRL